MLGLNGIESRSRFVFAALSLSSIKNQIVEREREREKMVGTTDNPTFSTEKTAEEKAIDDWLPITSSRTAKWWYSTFHNVTAMVGAGVLSLPYAMSNMGWYIYVYFLFLINYYLMIRKPAITLITAFFESCISILFRFCILHVLYKIICLKYKNFLLFFFLVMNIDKILKYTSMY